MTKMRGGPHKNYKHSVGDKTGFVTPMHWTNPRTRPCPRCGAEPGQPCRRTVGGRVGGKDIGGGYVKPLKNVHEERKRKQST